jgi:uncharacterized membrane protein
MNTNTNTINATMRQQRNYRYVLSLVSILRSKNMLDEEQVKETLQILEEMKRESEDQATALEYTQDTIGIIDRSIKLAKAELDIIAKDNEYHSHYRDAIHSDSLELIQKTIIEATELRCLIVLYSTYYISTYATLANNIDMLLSQLRVANSKANPISMGELEELCK